MSKVKICKLFLRNYKQFKKLELDFTNAKGEPVDQVCFIGKNGTGKSTILNYLDRVLGYLTRPNDGLDSLMKIKIGDEYIYRLNSKTYGVLVFLRITAISQILICMKI